MSTLPPKIHGIIFEFVDESQDLLALLTVCKAFRSEIENLLYRVVTLKSYRYYSPFLSVIIVRPELALQVHALTFSIQPPQPHEIFPFGSFAQALCLLDNLKSLTFDYHSFPGPSLAWELCRVLDSTTVNFQLSSFRDRNFSLWRYPQCGNFGSKFIKNQRELQIIQLNVNPTDGLGPSALPKLKSVHSTPSYSRDAPSYSRDGTLHYFIGNRSITHLKIVQTLDVTLPLPPIPSLEVLSILEAYVPSGLSELFPQLIVLECLFKISLKSAFLNNTGKLKNLTVLTLKGISEPRRLDSFDNRISDDLIQEVFSCIGSLTTLGFVDGRFGRPDPYSVLSFKRGGCFQKDRSREVRKVDDWMKR